MKQITLPRPDEIRPGAVFRDQGSVVEIRRGKHGDGDLKVLVNNHAVSHQVVAWTVMAIYLAEERYRRTGGQGGDYFVVRLKSWIYWVRAHLRGKANPLDPFEERFDD